MNIFSIRISTIVEFFNQLDHDLNFLPSKIKPFPAVIDKIERFFFF